MADNPAPDCLLRLIGLSRGEGSCFALPAEGETGYITDSATGLYLDSAEGLMLRPASGQPAAADVWEQLRKARELGGFALRADLLVGRAAAYGAPLYQQRGLLGGQGNGQLAPVGTRALVRFSTNARQAGAWRIPALRVLTAVPLVDAPLLIDGTQVALISTDAEKRVINLPAKGLVIPLDGGEHSIEVVLPDGVRPMQNKLYCFGCNAGSPWKAAVETNIKGWDSNTLGNGLSFSVIEECTAIPDFLCYIAAVYNEEGSEATQKAEVARYLGIALLYKSAELFTRGLMVNQQLSRYTMLEPKALAYLSDKYQEKAATYVKWLVSPDGLGSVSHPCFTGPPRRGPGLIWTG